MKRRRIGSLGVRWSIRYGALILAVIAVVGFFAYRRSQELAVDDARELLELQAADLAENVSADRATARAAIDRVRAAAEPDLRLSVQLFAAGEREPWIAAGVPEVERLAPPAAATAGRAQDFRTVWLDHDYPFWVYGQRLEDGGWVQVTMYGRSFIRRAKRIRYAFLAALPLAVAASALLGVLVTRSSLRPVAEILESARRLGGERLDQRIPVRGTGDEFDQIAEVMNEALARIESAVVALRRYSLDAAHQLRTPLTVLRSRIEVALRSEAERADPEHLLEELLEDVVQLGEMVDAMLSLARSAGGLEPEQRQPVALEPVLEAVADFFGPFAEEQGKKLECVMNGRGTVLGDETWLHQLFVNLVDNAVRYTAPGDLITVELETGAGHATVRVRDSGPGIPPAERSTVFERFHRVAPGGPVRGAGLGLALAREIATVHGGSVWAESTPGGGATFCVRLPLARRVVAGAQGAQSRSSSAPS